MLEAIAGGIPDGRDRVRDCSPLRPGTQERANSRTGAPHTQRNCCTQTLALNTLGWRLTGNGGKRGLNVINGLIRAELCVAQ